ncbi:MAG TPA: hypothetical protein VJL35_01775 [Gemmatimonadaceae bacterium]|nr:hypothetical protein [Gemmatimonadaceae bacterium]
MRKFFAFVLMTTAAVPAHSQVRRRVPRVLEPSAWATFSIGLFNANDVSDGRTESVWDFGRASNPQYRVSLEKAISNTASVGGTASYVRAPFTYLGTGGESSCERCAAHLDIATLGASFHVGGGIGLHQVIEASAGALAYRNLKRDDTKEKLAPTGGNVDPYFTFAYGFGYSLNPSAQVSVVQEFGLAIHERTGLTSEDSNTLTQRTLRLNFRYGFGNRVRTTR